MKTIQLFFLFLLFAMGANAQLKIGNVKKAEFGEVAGSMVEAFVEAKYHGHTVYYYYSRHYDNGGDTLFAIANINGKDQHFKELPGDGNHFQSLNKLYKLEVKYSDENFKTGRIIVRKGKLKATSNKLSFRSHSG